MSIYKIRAVDDQEDGVADNSEEYKQRISLWLEAKRKWVDLV